MIGAACESAEKVIADTRKAYFGTRQGPTVLPTLDKVQAAKIQEQENLLRNAVNHGEGVIQNHYMFTICLLLALFPFKFRSVSLLPAQEQFLFIIHDNLNSWTCSLVSYLTRHVRQVFLTFSQDCLIQFLHFPLLVKEGSIDKRKILYMIDP